MIIVEIDYLFDGEIRTGSMVKAVESSLHHDVKVCNMCVKQALSWSGYSSVSSRIESLKNIAAKLKDVEARKILINAITLSNIT